MNFKHNESVQKLRGGYYTDPRIAKFLLDWALEIDPDALLEPSCGDGVFFAELAKSSSPKPMKVFGCELDPADAHKARGILKSDQRIADAGIFVGDFLRWSIQKLNSPPEFDAVVGNPPFIRYQYLDKDIQDRAEILIKTLGLHFTRHTNAWVPFVIASITQLRPGGRLAMVVPSELLHVLHAQSARQYLLSECSRVVVVDPEEIWFTDTLQGVVLLLAEKRTSTEGAARAQGNGAMVAIERVRGEEFLAKGASGIVATADFFPGDSVTGKWTIALLNAKEKDVFDKACHSQNVKVFSEVASISVGIVTGANKFFLVPDEVVSEYELEDFSHPMFGRSEHVPGVLYNAATHKENRAEGLPTNFLWFDDISWQELPNGAQRYIRSGEERGLHRRYKCRIREPWYEVPSVFSVPVGMLKRSHEYPRLILNTIRAFTTDTAYRISPTKTSSRKLVYGFVNSLTALCCELEGRHYGGGVLELVPSEIARLRIPVSNKMNGDINASLRKLDKLFREGAPAAEILMIQDQNLLTPLGLCKDEQQVLLEAWHKLKSRRHRTG